VCTPMSASGLPFSTREVLATISSPLRVCLTPWSVFQDGGRHAITSAPDNESQRSKQLARGCCKLCLRSFPLLIHAEVPAQIGISEEKPPKRDIAPRMVLVKRNGRTSFVIVTISGSISPSLQNAFQTFAHATCSISVFLLCI
jgi:hypothetical protein